MVILLAAAAWLVGRLWLRLGANETAKMMPADTDLYVIFNPGLRQLIRLNDLSRLQVLGAPVEALGLADALGISESINELGIDFQTDVRPWIGLEAAVSVMDIEDASQGVVVAAATRSRKASDKFLQKLRDQMEAGGSSFDETTYRRIPIAFEVVGSEEKTAFATLNRFVVVADSLAAMQQVIDATQGEAPNLGESSNYRDLMRHLPSNRSGAIYVPQALTRELGEVLGLGVFEGYRGLAIALSLEANRACLDIVQEFGTDTLSRAEIDYIRRSGHSPQITRAIPDDALFVLTGKDLPTGWRMSLGSIPGFSPEGIDDIVEEIRYDTGVDLEEDIFSWMTGEYALVALGDPDDPLALDMPISLLFVAEVPGRDQRQAERAVNDLFEALALNSDATLETRTLNGIEMHTFSDRWSDFSLGYGMLDEHLVVGVSLSTLRAAARAKDNPLAEYPTFQQSVRPLPKNNHGVFYLNVRDVVRLLKRSMSDYERQDFEKEVEPYLDPLVAVSGTSLPADKNGFQRSVIYLHLAQ